ncbi:MAG: hypothetical protein J7517_06350 [Sphingobium yanoikuyae]|nr:hypothetical protein [Sphingobium yanoikuyae]
MYTTEEGGRSQPAHPGWGCPCMISRSEPLIGWDAILLLGEDSLHPGDKRRLGFYFLSGESAAAKMRQAAHFYLWEGKFIGEAIVVG